MDSGDSTGVSPATAFALLGHEHRVDILHALLDANQHSVETPIPFSKLFARTEIAVSSQFSYHLEELTGQFIRDTGDGYELRYAGWKVATAILAGTYNEHASFGPTSVTGTCPNCGMEMLVAVYESEWLAISCRDCDTRHIRYPIPPGAVQSRSVPALLEAFDRYVRSHMARARDGVCPACLGVMEIKTDPDDNDTLATGVCQRCGNRLYPPVGLFFRDHERVTWFRHEYETDRLTVPFWELNWCVTDDAVEVTGTDPWQCRLEIAAEEASLVLLLGDGLAVHSTTIENA
ncbi:ArsR family transcriptional regulator [Halovenus rubra]|uniref:ArsR family transcriptional regulator n=2 Tax=Halovenus rubra TaxID=869890 RepID=A0ACC7DX14_9EURY|nr:hypothetical protein [Halovenus rubra]